MTKRAARAHLATALLGANKAPGRRPPQPLWASLGASSYADDLITYPRDTFSMGVRHHRCFDDDTTMVGLVAQSDERSRHVASLMFGLVRKAQKATRRVHQLCAQAYLNRMQGKLLCARGILCRPQDKYLGVRSGAAWLASQKSSRAS